MRIALLSGACMASAMLATASGATPLFAANPTRLDPDPNTNDAGLLGIKHDTSMHVDGAGGDQGLKGSYSMVNDSDLGGANGGDSIDYGLANMAVASDDRSPRISGSNGHIASAKDLDIDADDDQSRYDTTTPAFTAAALTATTDAGAFASG